MLRLRQTDKIRWVFITGMILIMLLEVFGGKMFSFPIKKAQASLDSGWLSNYSYRKKITITGQTGAGTNYQVKLGVGESSGSAGADFNVGGNATSFPSDKDISGDLRFTASDQATLLDFWVESVSGTTPNRTATIWVEVSASLETNQDIYIYYGGLTTTNVSNGTNTFVFYDDFSGSSVDSNLWASGGTGLSVASSILTIVGADGVNTPYIESKTTYAYYAMRYRANMSTANGVGLYGFQQSNIAGNNDYIAFNPRSSTIEWVITENDTSYSYVAITKDYGNWNIYDVNWYSSSLGKLYRNAVQVGGDVTSNLPNQAIKVAFFNYSGITTQIDWTLVRKLIATEPAYSSAGSEEAPSIQFAQNYYRWYSNTDGIQPSVTAVAENTATTSIGNGEVLRLRTSIQILADSTAPLATSTQRFRLQYAAATSTCNFYMPWTTVASSTDNTSGIWRGYDNSSAADEATTTANLLSVSDVLGSYKENNDTAKNLYYAAIGQDMEYDWVIQNNAAVANTTWCFRMVSLDSNNASSTLTTYNNYPQLTTIASYNATPSVPSSLGSASTTVGNWISSTTPSVAFSLSDSDGADTVKYEVQIDDASNFSSPAVDYISGLAAQGGRMFQVGQATSTGGYITGFAGQTLSDASYYWRVLTADNSNASSTWSTANSGGVAFKIDNTAPSGVGVPTFGTVTTSSIVVNMPTTITESGSGLRTWTARRDSTTDLTETATTTASITDSALSPNMQYTYDAKFTDMATNTSAYGTSASKYTLANAPTLLSAAANSGTQITFSWNANSNPGTTEYYAENTTKGTNSGWITDVSWASTGLACGTSYTFRVKARNGNSTDTAWTDDSSKTTSACAVTSGGSGGPPAYAPPSAPTSSTDNPEGGFKVVINEGADTTNSQIVDLKLFGGPDARKMAISNSSGFYNVNTENYSTNKQWNLCYFPYSSIDPPPCVEGTHYVYVKFYNDSNEATDVVMDSIVWKKELAPSPPVKVTNDLPKDVVPPVITTPTTQPTVTTTETTKTITIEQKLINPTISNSATKPLIEETKEIKEIPQQIQNEIIKKPTAPIVETPQMQKPSAVEKFVDFIKPIVNIVNKTPDVVNLVFVETPIKIAKTITEQGNNLIVKAKDSTVRLLLTIFYGSQPLKITNVQITEKTNTSALITWETNQSATSKVNYGLNTSYGLDSQSSERTTKHSVLLTDLKPDTLYYFEVMSQNANRYAYDAYHNFKTPSR